MKQHSYCVLRTVLDDCQRENMEIKSPKISALRFLFGLVAASWKYRITSDTFCCPTCLLPTKWLNRWSFEIIIMSLRQWELKIHLCLSLVLKSPLWILFPAYLNLNYLSDFCCSSSGVIVLLPSVPGDPFWSKCTDHVRYRMGPHSVNVDLTSELSPLHYLCTGTPSHWSQDFLTII